MNPIVLFLGASLLMAGSSPGSLNFEELIGASDRVVRGQLLGASGGSVRLPGGREIDLGIKDAATGRVFTPYRVRVAECLFYKQGTCELGEVEVLVPGGTVYENCGGERRLRTWEVAGAAGAPLPPAGEDVVLFLHESNGKFVLVPTPTSGKRHAIPGSFDARDPRGLGQPSPRLRAGQDGHRSRSSLELGDDLCSTDESERDRRSCGP